MALVQSHWVAQEIKKKYPDYEFEFIPFKTLGDQLLDERLDKIGGKGLFVNELEEALIRRVIDIAVHSLKDMPAKVPEELTIAAVSKREDPRDVLISLSGKSLEELACDAVIGTSSIRREVQVKRLKPGLVIKMLRGNVPTRIDKLDRNEYDAIILAAAGLKRLGLANRCTQYFTVEQMVPSVGQGALGIETHKDADVEYLKMSVHNEEAFLTTRAERAYMNHLNGSCSTPIAAHGVITGTRMKLYGFLAAEDQSDALWDWVEGSVQESHLLGITLAKRMMERRKVHG